MKYDRPIVWSVAGFDPTGGAGVLADTKTFEQHRTLGMGFLSSTTIQKEDEFIAVSWLKASEIIEQMKPIVEDYPVSALKIGIVENLETALEITSFIRKKQTSCRIVWDPVLSASSGYPLHKGFDMKLLREILQQVDLMTPNTNEARKLTSLEDEIEAAFFLGNYTSVLLKGGHSLIRQGVDLLIEDGNPHEIVGHENNRIQPKHGSGCILSAAITANLALGENLAEACRKAKKYIEERLASNPNLLAYHVR